MDRCATAGEMGMVESCGCFDSSTLNRHRFLDDAPSRRTLNEVPAIS
jgi:hypothetical protein